MGETECEDDAAGGEAFQRGAMSPAGKSLCLFPKQKNAVTFKNVPFSSVAFNKNQHSDRRSLQSGNELIASVDYYFKPDHSAENMCILQRGTTNLWA